MSRPVRKTRLQKKIDSESSSLASEADLKEKKLKSETKHVKESNNSRETTKKVSAGNKWAPALRDKTNISNELGKDTKQDDLPVGKKTVELPETNKRSTRLRAKKSTSSENEKESISEENETQKHRSEEVRRGSRLGKSNQYKENYADDRKSTSDDLRGKNSPEHPKTNTSKPDELHPTEDDDSEDTKAESDDQGRKNSKSNPKITRNKFFISKQPGSVDKQTLLQTQRAAIKKNTVKNAGRQIKRKESLGYAASLRQTTLSESFSRGSLRTRLRPRKNMKDYKDSSSVSVLLEKSISPEKRKSFVLLEKIDEPKANKEPIYRTVKLAEKSTDDKDSVYDFQFDVNDPGEKPKNKRRRNAARKPAATKKKKKNDLLCKNHNNNRNNNEAPELPKKPSEKDPKPLQDKKELTNDKKVGPLHTEIKNAEENKSDRFAEPKEAVVSPKKLPAVENVEEQSPRIRISNIETLTGDRKVSFRPNPSTSHQSSVKFNPFRSSQSIFKPRSTLNAREMMDHSLLNKSLSPIKNDLDSFDAASPWRPPLPASFSTVKRIFQSTPQIKRNFGRTTLGLRIEEGDENGENAEAKSPAAARPEGTNSAEAKSPVKSGSKPPLNPLGVRISNAENIQASNTKINGQGTNPSLAKFGIARKPLGLASNYEENKENSSFGDRLYKSPKKNEKAMGSLESPGLKKRSSLLSPRGETSGELLSRKKDSEVQHDENLPPGEGSKLLKQSNLNTFLNLDEMPETISINTSHGIFGDGAHCTPIIKNQSSRIQTEASIDNCFGFDEDNSDVQEPNIKLDRKQQTATPVKSTFDRLKRRDFPTEKQGAARISLGEIKNTLYPRKDKKVEKLERIEKTDKKRETRVATSKETKTQKNPTKSKDILHPIQFSDTFDVLSESERTDGGEKSMGNEIALFADLEPVHFTKPPRWSYTKKRERKQYWSSDEEDNEDIEDGDKQPVLKKRKLTKLNKIEAKKIDEWVKSVNETFQEIDDFDLVVEKLP